MENINIEKTENAPEVAFDFGANHFELRGLSYMEDTDGFYGTLIESLNTHLSGLKGAEVRFEFALEYFNSSSARVIYHLFQKLDAVAGAGNAVVISWDHGGDDDLEEQGEEFSEDLEHATFTMTGGAD